MYQMKEQDKTPGKQLNEVEIGNLPEKEFRIMILKMIQDLRKRMEAKIGKMQEMLNKDPEELNEATIRKYIQEQEAHDIAMDKLSVKEYEDPFKG